MVGVRNQRKENEKMKKSLVSLMIGLLMLGVSGNVWAESSGGGLSLGHTAEDVQCSGCVNDTDIATGAVTNSKIADGSVTDAKIGGTISASKIEKPANVVVVAKSGGDYTTINAALAAINPTASNPYVIKVMPGRYEENDAVRMKSYVHLQGAGKDVTTVLSSYYSLSHSVICSGVTNITVTGFTITTTPYLSEVSGIVIDSSTFVTIENNHFTGSNGIYDTGSTATTIIRGNIFSDMRAYYNKGIQVGDWSYPFRPSSPVITGNLFKGIYAGIRTGNGTPLISNNIFTENGSGITGGGTPTIKDNVFTGNTVGLVGVSLVLSNKSTGNDCDIRIYGSSPIMSYNVFDTLCGVDGIPAGGYVGKYNLKSDGTDAPTTDTFQ